MGHIVLAVVLATFAPSGLEEGTGLPANLKGGPFQATLEIMWRTSATFRAQCARIAMERALTVQLRAEGAPRPGSARARTEFSRRNGVLTRADIVIADARDRVELIGHELEHVVEQIEGVRLGERRCSEDGFVTSVHESCRAMEAGRRIAREVLEAGR
jgi:hypothetical protein